MFSTVLIISADLRDAGNAVAEAMGWGPGNYSVPLSADGQKPATHYGLHAWSSKEFRRWVEGTEELPEGMEAAKPVIDSVIASFQVDSDNHWNEVLKTKGLNIIDAE